MSRDTRFDQSLSAASLFDRRTGMAVVAELAMASGPDGETVPAGLLASNVKYALSGGRCDPIPVDAGVIRATCAALVAEGAAIESGDGWAMLPDAYTAWLSAPWIRR